MNKTVLTMMMAIVIITLSVTGCKKDDPASGSTTHSANKARALLLTNGAVKLWRPGPVENQNGPLWSAPCGEDDRVHFGYTGTLKYTMGDIKCSPNEQTLNGSWAFPAEGKITIKLNGNSWVSDIVELSDSVLKMKYIQLSDTITETYLYP